MGKIKSAIYPHLQRMRYKNLISAFEKGKKQDMIDNQILMLSTSKGSLGGNLGAIKSYIELNLLDYKIITVTSVDQMSIEELGSVMAQSRFIMVDDFEPMVYVLSLRPNQQLVQVWHAMGAFKRFGYGRATAESGSLTHKNYTKAIVSSPEIVDIYAESFGISRDKIIPVGTPRTDAFFDEKYVSLAKERLYGKAPELKNKRICLFAPTFRGQNVNDAFYPSEFIDLQALSNSLGGDWAVIVKLHPFVKGKLDIPKSNSIFDFSDEREINDILFITDVLVTDYSSVIFENAIIGNPAVLYAPDYEQYNANRGFYYDYNDYSCGSIVTNQSELADAIKSITNNNPQYMAFKQRFVSLCDGNSCRRFVEKILEENK